MAFSKVLDHYYQGQIHDATPVWDSGNRHWHQFAELKAPLVMTLQPQVVMRQVEVAWVADETEFESGANDSKGIRRGVSRMVRRFARQTTVSWFGVPRCV